MRSVPKQTPTADASHGVRDTDDWLLTTRDVASRWQCSTRHVLRLVAAGHLETVSLPHTRSAAECCAADPAPASARLIAIPENRTARLWGPGREVILKN